MKLKKIILILFLAISFIIVISNNIKSYSYTTINSQTLFEASIFNSLELNYQTLPTVTVAGEFEDYLLYNTETGTTKKTTLWFYNTTVGQTLDCTVNVLFEDCGTLNGKSIDIKYVYSNITMVSNMQDESLGIENAGFLFWKAFGSEMKDSNEWFYAGIEKANVDIYFYYSGETSPIDLSSAFLTLFSEDPGEGISSSNASSSYLYTETNVLYYAMCRSKTTSIKYTNLFIGSSFGSTDIGAKNAVCFQYKNVDHLAVSLYAFDGFGGNGAYVGYHFKYTSMNATVPEDPIKEVDKNYAYKGGTLTYTITQTMPESYNDEFYLASLYFSDTLDSNLIYKELELYDQNNNNITSSSGSISYDSSSNSVKYTFSSTYLENMEYTGEQYTFKITVDVKEEVDINTIENEAYVNFNNKYEINSNTITTNIVGDVITFYKDLQGNEIEESSTSTGNIGENYLTTKKEIEGYTFIKDTGNAEGIYEKDQIEVTYYYAKNSNVYVYYVDEQENQIEEIEKIKGYEGKEYVTTKKEIEGYYFRESTDNTSGTMKAEDIIVTYVYSKIEKGNVLLKKVDSNGNYLEGAVFKIATSEENALSGNFIEKSNGEDITATSDSEGNILFENLVYKDETSNDEVNGRSYWVVEVQAPMYTLSNGEQESYMLVANPIEIKVNAISGVYDENSTIKIVNRKKFSIPVTGMQINTGMAVLILICLLQFIALLFKTRII